MKRFLLIAATLATTPAAADQVITKCVNPVGKSYFSVPKQGWQDDGITNGSLLISKSAEGKYSITFTDAARTINVEEDGGVVTPTHINGGDITLAVVYPRSAMEVYQLTLDANGSGEVIWVSMKNGAPFVKGAMFVAKCSK